MKRLLLTLALLGIAITTLAQTETTVNNTPLFDVQQLPTELNGQWQFCIEAPNERYQRTCKNLEVPGYWEDQGFDDYDGYGVYRFRFLLDQELDNKNLGLWIYRLRDSDETYLNGNLIGKTGDFPPNFEKATLYSRLYSLPNTYLFYDRPNEITIKIYNHARFGGVYLVPPVIDEINAINAKHYQTEFWFIAISAVLTLTSIILLVYFIFMPAGKDNLFFSLSCIGEAVYLLTYSHLPVILDLNLTSVFRLNVFLYAFIIFCFVNFLHEFFRTKLPFGARLILGILVIPAVGALIWPDIDLIYYAISMISVGLIVLIAIYILPLLARSISSGLPYAKSIALVLGLLVSTTIFDVLVDFNILNQTGVNIAGLVSPFVMILVFLTVTIILTHKYWQYYRGATFDYLTGTLRRSPFIARVNEEMERSLRSEKCLILAFIDLDDFKLINDSFGHATGDMLLGKVADRLRHNMRQFDLVSRFGGDEFCVAIQVDNPDEGKQTLARISVMLSEINLELDSSNHISTQATIGAVMYDPNRHRTPEDMIKEADEAMLQTKIHNKGGISI